MPAGVSVRHFLLPDLGEGLTEAEIVAWHVAAGDEVALNQVLVDVETEKAVVELPSPFAGTVVEVLAREGETVGVGSPIIAIDTSGDGEGARRAGARAGRVRPVRGPPEPPPPQRAPACRPGPGAAGTRRVKAARPAAGALHGTPERGRSGGRHRPRPGRRHHARGPRGPPGRRQPPPAGRRGDAGPRVAGTRARRPEAHGRRHGPQRGGGAAGVRLPDARCHTDHGARRAPPGQPALRGHTRHAPRRGGPGDGARPARCSGAELLVGRGDGRGRDQALRAPRRGRGRSAGPRRAERQGCAGHDVPGAGAGARGPDGPSPRCGLYARRAERGHRHPDQRRRVRGADVGVPILNPGRPPSSPWARCDGDPGSSTARWPCATW